MKLIYSKQAVADLDRLRAFIAEHDPDAASRVTQALITRVDMLREFPQIGVELERNTAPAEIRDMVFGKYVVRYSIHETAVFILRVWHHLEERS